MESIFVTSLLNDKVMVKPDMLSGDMRSLLEQTLRDKYEGVCSYHGFIKPESIKILKYSMGFVQSLSLNGDVVYRVQYQANVCNPVIGNVIRCRVANMNKFGILAEATTVLPTSNRKLVVLDVIVPKNSPAIVSAINLETVKINDEIFVEIMGKKFELHDKKISIVGRVVLPSSYNAKANEAVDHDEDENPVDEVDDENELEDDEDESEHSDEEDDSDEDDSDEDENVVDEDEDDDLPSKHVGGRAVKDDDELEDEEEFEEDDDENEDDEDEDVFSDDEDDILG